MLTFIAFGLLATQGQTPATMPSIDDRITSVSMFKNGYALVMRELRVPNAGEFLWENVPRSSLGTFWITSDPETKLSSVTAIKLSRSKTQPIDSLLDLLAQNIGKDVQLSLTRQLADDPTTVSGKIVSATTGLVILESANGTQGIPIGSILRVTSSGKTLASTRTDKTEVSGLRLSTEGAGRIAVASLERGFTWVPNYSLDLIDDKRLTLTAKATVFDEVQDLVGANVQFITGFPNLPYAFVPDPITGTANLDEFLSILRNLPGSGDGNVNSLMMFQNRAAEVRGAGGPGGSMPAPAAPEASDDLFFYPVSNFSLKKGERSYRTLFRNELPYRDFYAWNVETMISDEERLAGFVRGDEVSHYLSFRNDTKQPLSTGAVTLFRQGQIIGQDMLNYVPSGGDVKLKLNRALDVITSAQESETSRDRLALDLKQKGKFDRVSIHGALEIHNTKPTEIVLRITRNIKGESVKAEGSPEITKPTDGGSSLNPSTTYRWEIKVPAGGRTKLGYDYRVYVPIGVD